MVWNRVHTPADYLVVGAGSAGSVVAERLADAGKRVLVIDKRLHVGGNAFDEKDRHGVLIHRYGPHIFHSNSKRVVDYLSQFTAWRHYEHRALARIGERLFPIPPNLDTINSLYDLDLDESGAKRLLERVRTPFRAPRNSEEVVLNAVGRELYETFFRGYMRKHWGFEPSRLSAGVAAKIPVRTNRDDRYFTDTYQMMPLEGYTKLFQRLLDHPNIDVRLGVDYFEKREALKARHIVFTGPIDAYYDFCYGNLPYRSLRFEHEHLPGESRFQPVGTVNYPNEFAFTRITEFKHLTGQHHSGTSIVREFPQDEGEPCYPVPLSENERLYRRYQNLSIREKYVTFVGRLAQYRYYNIDQAVGAALTVAERLRQRAAA